MQARVRLIGRTFIRLRPGGLLPLRPDFLRRLGWTLADEVLVEFESDRIGLFKKPSEQAWRIHRLRCRINPAYAERPVLRGFEARSYREYRALHASRWRPRRARQETTSAALQGQIAENRGGESK